MLSQFDVCMTNALDQLNNKATIKASTQEVLPAPARLPARRMLMPQGPPGGGGSRARSLNAPPPPPPPTSQHPPPQF